MINTLKLLAGTIFAWIIVFQVEAISRGVSLFGSTALQMIDSLFIGLLVLAVALTIVSAVSVHKVRYQGL